MGSIGRSSLAESWSGTEFPGSAQWREAPRVEIPPGATALHCQEAAGGLAATYIPTLCSNILPLANSLSEKGKTYFRLEIFGKVSQAAQGSDWL